MSSPNDHIIREQLSRLEAMEKELSVVKRALRVALGDVKPSPKTVEFKSPTGKTKKVRLK